MRNIILAVLLIGSISLFGAWDDYSWYKSHAITGASGAGADYQVEIITHYGAGTDTLEHVYLNSKTQVDFEDVAFFDNDQTTQLYCWLMEKTNSDSARFLVKVADNLDSNQTIYVVYGDADGTSQSNGDSTFIFFDDFNDGTWDTGKWEVLDYYSNTITDADESGGTITLSAKRMNSISEFTSATAIRARGAANVTGGSEYGSYCGGYKDNEDWDERAYWDAYGDDSYFRHVTKNAGTIDYTLSSYAKDTDFHIFEVARNGSTSVIFTIDDDTVNQVTDTSDIPSINMGVLLGGRPDGATKLGIYECDWILVRKYVSPEPAHSTWGSETAIGAAAITIDHIDGFELDVDIDYIQ